MTDWDERLSKMEQNRDEAAEEARIAQEKQRESSDSSFSQFLDLARWAIAKYQSVNESPIPIYVDGQPKYEKPIFGKPRKVFPPRIQAGSGYLLHIDHEKSDLTELGGLNIGHDPRALNMASRILDGANRIWLATSGNEVIFLSGSPFSSPENFSQWSGGTAEWTVNNREAAFKYSGPDPEDQIAFQIRRAQEAAKDRFAKMADRDEFLESVVKYVDEHATNRE
jgi:hypothetical protein